MDIDDDDVHDIDRSSASASAKPQSVSSSGSSISFNSKTQLSSSSLSASKEQKQERNKFSVLTFNVLAEFLARSEWFPYCKRHHLKWSYRSEKIKEIIRESNADIICLQEVQTIESIPARYREFSYSFFAIALQMNGKS